VPAANRWQGPASSGSWTGPSPYCRFPIFTCAYHGPPSSTILMPRLTATVIATFEFATTQLRAINTAASHHQTLRKLAGTLNDPVSRADRTQNSYSGIFRHLWGSADRAAQLWSLSTVNNSRAGFDAVDDALDVTHIRSSVGRSLAALSDTGVRSHSKHDADHGLRRVHANAR